MSVEAEAHLARREPVLVRGAGVGESGSVYRSDLTRQEIERAFAALPPQRGGGAGSFLSTARKWAP
jgi:hypothetical protein